MMTTGKKPRRQFTDLVVTMKATLGVITHDAQRPGATAVPCSCALRRQKIWEQLLD